jgi:hypothetical protein
LCAECLKAELESQAKHISSVEDREHRLGCVYGYSQVVERPLDAIIILTMMVMVPKGCKLSPEVAVCRNYAASGVDGLGSSHFPYGDLIHDREAFVKAVIEATPAFHAWCRRVMME